MVSPVRNKREAAAEMSPLLLAGKKSNTIRQNERSQNADWQSVQYEEYYNCWRIWAMTKPRGEGVYDNRARGEVINVKHIRLKGALRRSFCTRNLLECAIKLLYCIKMCIFSQKTCRYRQKVLPLHRFFNSICR